MKSHNNKFIESYISSIRGLVRLSGCEKEVVGPKLVRLRSLRSRFYKDRTGNEIEKARGN